jgi:hypothetical protein
MGRAEQGAFADQGAGSQELIAAFVKRAVAAANKAFPDRRALERLCGMAVPSSEILLGINSPRRFKDGIGRPVSKVEPS